MINSEGVTTILKCWVEGDKSALGHAMTLVYQELHKIAADKLSREQVYHSFQATEIINELFLRLQNWQPDFHWQNRRHFFGVAANIIRNILIDHAKNHLTLKHGAGAIKVSINALPDIIDKKCLELIKVNDALASLAVDYPLQSQIIELRQICGFTLQEVAEILDISLAKVHREEKLATLMLCKLMS